jgi:hypothetical protein
VCLSNETIPDIEKKKWAKYWNSWDGSDWLQQIVG